MREAPACLIIPKIWFFNDYEDKCRWWEWDGDVLSSLDDYEKKCGWQWWCSVKPGKPESLPLPPAAAGCTLLSASSPPPSWEKIQWQKCWSSSSSRQWSTHLRTAQMWGHSPNWASSSWINETVTSFDQTLQRGQSFWQTLRENILPNTTRWRIKSKQRKTWKPIILAPSPLWFLLPHL